MSWWWSRHDVFEGETESVGVRADLGTPEFWPPFFSITSSYREQLLRCLCEQERDGHVIASSRSVPDRWTVVHPGFGLRLRACDPAPESSALDVVVAMACHAWVGRPLDPGALAAIEFLCALGVTNPLDLFLAFQDALELGRDDQAVEGRT